MFSKNDLTQFGKIIYEDEGLFILNKRSSVKSEDISPLICHRLDRDTSGILIIAKNQNIKEKIQEQFKKRIVKKKYLALVLGKLEEKEVVEGFIFRAKAKEERKFISSFQIPNFVVSNKKSEKYSKTEIKPLKILFKEIFKNSNQKDLNYFTLVEAYPETGRTHQIRLHLAFLHHPILGDNLYGGKINKKISQKLNIQRLLLHALEISFRHPITDKLLNFKSKIPEDFEEVLKKLGD